LNLQVKRLCHSERAKPVLFAGAGEQQVPHRLKPLRNDNLTLPELDRGYFSTAAGNMAKCFFGKTVILKFEIRHHVAWQLGLRRPKT
jgi:hypothetical protein